MSDELIHERRGNVLVARLNRPEARNALSPTLLAALGEAVLEAESDVDIRALVVTGTGDRAFCAGMDLRAFAEGGATSDGRAEATEAMSRLFRGEVGVPIVGAANATAVAGGLELLLASDVIVASSEAKFGLPEVKRGLFPAGGGTTLGRRIPFNIAMELLLTGDTVDAARAYELGLVNAVVAPDQVLPAALALAERIAENGPLALRATKELARLAITDDAKWNEKLTEWQPVIFNSHDAKEGATAFVEKRTPVWRGE
jgi:enoyl-CoA hydratase